MVSKRYNILMTGINFHKVQYDSIHSFIHRFDRTKFRGKSVRNVPYFSVQLDLNVCIIMSCNRAFCRNTSVGHFVKVTRQR